MRRALGVVLVCVLVAALSDAAAGTRRRRLPRHKFAVKTIQSEDGDIIDCVDVYKQPSLEHLSSENRTNMQIFRSRPSSTSNLDPSKNQSRIQQRWQKSGSCPEGTIPILRTTPFRYGTDGFGLPPSVEKAVGYGHGDGPFLGARAKMQRWKMDVEPDEYSMTYITLMTGSNPDVLFFGDLDVTEFVRVGFMANPAYFGDNEARFFVQWSTDNGATTGCFNLDCGGFVQTNPRIALGAVLLPPSLYNDPAHQPALAMDLALNTELQRWYAEVETEQVGYWPVEGLFKNLRNHAPWVTWGGEVLNRWPEGQHTVTQMGNGHPPEEGRGRAATMFDLTTKEHDGIYQYKPAYYQDRPGCYNSAYQGFNDAGIFFSFGGSGGADCLFHDQKIPKIN